MEVDNTSALGVGLVKTSDYKGPSGKLIRVRLEEEAGEIRSVRISGDFFLVPEENLAKLEKVLLGARVQEQELRTLVNRFFNATRSQGLGISAEDLVGALLSAKEAS